VSTLPGSPPTENADLDTASDDYAERFSGKVGAWFLRVQAGIVLDLLRDLPAGARLIDVGGGHGQITPALIEAGFRVLMVGSHRSCADRLKSWLDDDRCRFEVADLQALPYDTSTFDAAVCFRLLPHSINWTGLIRELCRVTRSSVVLDYPSVRSINIISEQLFGLKKRIERNTRPFVLFHPRQVRQAFEENGFLVTAERPQFLIPMVVHRMAAQASLSRALEAPGRVTGLTRWLGSPVIVRADRRTLGT
jgi:SAM-dependent methyltransferase